MQLKDAMTTAIIASVAISGGRLVESRIKAPRIVIEEMALVALINGVCSRVGTLETKKYPTPRIKKKVPSITIIDSTETSPLSSLFLPYCFQGAPMQNFTLMSDKSLIIDLVF